VKPYPDFLIFFFAPDLQIFCQ